MDDSVLKIGGNRFKYLIGKNIQKLGNKLVSNNKYKLVTNPTCRLINPFTLIINFTIDGTEKYQLILQGDYKKHYKESEDYMPDISTNELFTLISSSKDKWFKKS